MPMQHDQFPVLDAIDVLDKIYKMDTPQAPGKDGGVAEETIQATMTN